MAETNPEVAALLKAYLDAVALTESVQVRIWKAARVTVGQVRVLHHLKGRPRSLGELAEELSLSPTSMTRLVDRLEERGFVERRRDGDDRRRVVAALLPAGAELVANTPILRGTPLREAADNLAPADRDRITAALQDLIAAVRAVEEELARPVAGRGR